MLNLKFLASFIPEIIGKSQKSKIGSRDPHVTPLDLILHFFLLVLTAIHVGAKFEISTFYRSGDIRGAQKFKSGLRDPHMTPFDLILHFFR